MTRAETPTLAQAPKRFRPKFDRVMLKRADPDEVTAGGILLPSSKEKKEQMQVAVILEVGPDVTQFKRHEWVVYLPYAGEIVEVSGNEFVIIREEDILGVLEE